MDYTDENLEEVIGEALKEKELKDSGSSRKRKLLRRALLTVAILAALVGGYFLVSYINLSEKGYDAASSLMQGTLLLEPLDLDADEDNPAGMLAEAVKLIRKGSYTRAEDILDIADTKIATDLSNLQDDDLDLLPEFELNLQRNNLVILQDNARWYRALLYLKAKKPRKALAVLKEIAASQSVHSGEAKEMLEEVGKR